MTIQHSQSEFLWVNSMSNVMSHVSMSNVNSNDGGNIWFEFAFVEDSELRDKLQSFFYSSYLV